MSPRNLAATALKLRDEQIRAKVVYFGEEQETNEELDAITETVVAELQALQAAGVRVAGLREPGDIENELVKNLQVFLSKLLSGRRKGFLRKKIEEIQRRITALFFNSELFSKISAESPSSVEVAWPDQAVFYALKRHETAIVADLHLLKYVHPGVREEAVARLQQFEKELRMEFLSRTTPELEKMLEIFRDALTTFFRQFRRELKPFCTQVMTESNAAGQSQVGYKISPVAFPQFRETFDRKFLELLETHVQAQVVDQAIAILDGFRSDTLRFIADPSIYSEICTVMCDTCYDYLYGEGYLDLPVEWRVMLDRG